ncbi:hypothetical protein EIP86_010969 [Pleurotus ostreatoroseus]|nr:hypothetical protein EIP86_010969 [Pleurotus ostreatoroseus]
MFRLDDQEGADFLFACAGYFEATTKAEATPTLSSVIQICHLISLVTTWGCIDAWRGMFKSATTLIDRIFPVHSINGWEAEGHEETCAAAFALLKEIDGRDRGLRAPVLGSHVPGADLALDVEDEVYKTWLANFNIEETDVPDTFINALLRTACGAHTWDKEGRTFWRVRRLQKQPEQQTEPEETAAAVPVRAEQVENQSWELWNLLAYMTPRYASTPSSDASSSASPYSLLPPMDSSLPLHHTAERTRPDVISADVAPAETLSFHGSHLHAAAKREATSVTTEPFSEETTIPPQSLIIEPVSGKIRSPKRG